MNNIKLLNVKFTADAEDTKSSVSITFQKKTGEVASRLVSPDDSNYDDVISIITDFQNGDSTRKTRDDFSQKLLRAVLHNDLVGLESKVDSSKYVSAHVSIDGQKVYVDGHEVDEVLEREIFALMSSENDDNDSEWQALIHFVEKLYNNTSEYVRNQFYGWLLYQVKNEKLTLTPSGNVIAYKGGKLETVDGEPTVLSIHQGHGFVNGQEYENSYLPNHIGDIVEIPREEVDADPDSPCSIGLHVGTWHYASDFAMGAVMTVEIDPADVVSVPSDYQCQKVRVCKYRVISLTKGILNEVVFDTDPDTDNSDFEIPDEFTGIDYQTQSGEKRHYDFPEIVDEDNDNITIVVDDDVYRTLNKSRVTFVNDDENEVQDSDVPEDFIAIDYENRNGDQRHYDFPEVVNETDTQITIRTQDGSYRTLDKDFVKYVFDDDEVCQNFDIPDEFTDIAYTDSTGMKHSYKNPKIVEVPNHNDPNNLTIQLPNGQYRKLNINRIRFLTI